MTLFTRLLVGLFVFGGGLVSMTAAQNLRTVVEGRSELDDDPHFLRFRQLRLNNEGQVAFYATHTFNLTPPFYASRGIWSEGGGDLDLVVDRRQNAAGTDTQFSNVLYTFENNDVGQTIFLSSLKGGEDGIWIEQDGTHTLIARTGDTVSGGGHIDNFTDRLPRDSYRIGYNNAGQAAFWMEVYDSELGRHGAALGVYRNGELDLIMRPGAPAPGTGGQFAATHMHPALSTGVINEMGQTAFAMKYGVWSEGSGALSLVASAGQAAPGTDEVFAGDFWDASINDQGQTHFFATLSGSRRQGIWSEASGALEAVALSGDLAPGTSANFRFFAAFAGDDRFNNAGETLFLAALEGEGVDISNSYGIWSDVGGTLELIAREGDAAPGTEENFARFFHYDLNNLGQAMFVAELTDKSRSRGIWAQDLDGELISIVKAGDQIDVDNGPDEDLRTVEGLLYIRDAQPGFSNGTELNDLGQVAFIARFTDGTSGVFVSSLVAVPEPSSLLLAVLAVAMLRGRRSWPVGFRGCGAGD